MAKQHFKPGDRVVWHHDFSTVHATGSIVRGEAAPPDAELGTVKEVANDEGTHFLVTLDSGDEKTLTFEELVKVDEAA